MPYKGKDITTFINQFDTDDQGSVRKLVDSLVFIDRKEIHRHYRNVVVEHLNKNGKRIAVFPMEKKYFVRGKEVKKDGKEKRKDYDSSVVIGRILKSLEQEFGVNKVINSPSLETIKQDKIQHVIFFEDTIGSGKRVLDFWTNYPVDEIKSIKSLCSYKKLKVSFCVFSHSSRGVENITSNSCIDKSWIISSVNSDYYLEEYDFSLSDLAEKYNKKIVERGSVGFRDSFVPVVFEHGCPNNLPLFLWKEKKGAWNALFPNRALPPSLQEYFSRKGAGFERICNLVSDKGCPKIAIGIMEDLGLGTIEKNYLIPILALKKLAYSSKRVEKILMLDRQIMYRCLRQLRELNLLESESYLISEKGRKFLNHFESKVEQVVIKNRNKNSDKGEVYLPESFGGTSAFV